MQSNGITVSQLSEFDEIIDVRSPSEFREDHIPGAINFPVLNDEERARVGTIYKQVSTFDAKKVGAALVSRNIADHIDEHFCNKPKNWRPLIYCWRGGSRSGAMVHILNKIGWRAGQLEGGYKSYRRSVLEELEILPAKFQYRVVCGLTGSGKSRLLQAIEKLGAQVLDLEGLALHRGSVLGNWPETDQPPQKLFDSSVWWKLRHFDPARPVYLEAESKKVGNIRVPEALIQAMWQGQCIRLEVSRELRITLLKEEYAHYLENPESLNKKLDFLTSIYGHDQIEKWKQLVQDGHWDSLVMALLERHYDPSYSRSMLKHYPHFDQGILLNVTQIDESGMLALARQAL
ncbi:tRNA 2-selenouridine(34) synthase MnmH [Sulfurirhabdus autotrophica]|uniref:tRNA 2-selenouridine synthase n=1 Tax=Sulfurirhabdus autotrophica TaxID=1706046 RepID=A0A4R3YI80_9PROT|nr:tRNA 2-selenouridine(34) synthase MnmH [Sulfurirhabdus autotrophica]TCV90704.1 tRNA 2-selenouridine synthase [Sulfurirhabdus autotrophica]